MSQEPGRCDYCGRKIKIREDYYSEQKDGVTCAIHPACRESWLKRAEI